MNQAICVGSTMYCAGQIPVNPGTGELVGDDIVTQMGFIATNQMRFEGELAEP